MIDHEDPCSPTVESAVFAVQVRMGMRHLHALPAVQGRDPAGVPGMGRRFAARPSPQDIGGITEDLLDHRAASPSGDATATPADRRPLHARADRRAPAAHRGEAADLLAGLLAAGSADLVSGYALPLPVTVICELFGVPEADRTVFRAWSNELVMPASPQTGASAGGALGAYLADLIHRKRGAQEADLLSDLVATAREPGVESPSPPRNSSATVHALLTHPDQLELQRNETELVGPAAEEALRHYAPVSSRCGRG
ncbi:hypothetical protein ACOB87_41970 [Streptomyces sp. YS-B37]|uniref:hypothetical protein n=1 Tax=Streptomyces sp. YS-B37 TaxID=3407669 RepID=UPI003B50B987